MRNQQMCLLQLIRQLIDLMGGNRATGNPYLLLVELGRTLGDLNGFIQTLVKTQIAEDLRYQDCELESLLRDLDSNLIAASEEVHQLAECWS